jgi:hypothetical protein
MFGSVRDAMSPRVLSVARAPPPRPRLLPWTPISMLMDHIPRCPCSHYVILLRDRIVHVWEELMAEAGEIKGRDLRLEVRRIRCGASRDRPGDFVWLDFAALRIYKHLVVEVTVTSARTNSNVPAVGASLPLRGSLAMGAQHAKIDVDLRNSSSLGTPSIQSVHDYHPYALEDGGRL